MASEQLEIEIVFDDGSVTKGLANVQKKTESTFKQAGKDSGDAFSNEFQDAFPGLSRGFNFLTKSLVGQVTLAASAIGAALATGFSIVKSGELELQTEKTFDILAKQAGLSGANIRAEFERAADGLAPMSDILQASKSAVIELEGNAARLPQVFDLARRVSLTMGGDVIQTFEAINSSIVSGNAKALRNVGLVIDNKKAYDDFAATLGTTGDKLSLAGKQQAILNAVLESGNSKFKEIDSSAQSVTIASKKLTVAVSELYGEWSKQIAQSGVGKFFDNVTNSITNYISKLKNAVAESNSPAKQLEFLNKQIDRLAANEEYFKSLPPNQYLSAYGKTAGEALAQLQSLNTQRVAIQQQQDQADASSTATAAANSETKKNKILEEASAVNNLSKEYQNLNYSVISASEASLDSVTSFSDQTLTFGIALQEQAKSFKYTFGDLAKTAQQTLSGAVSKGFQQVGLAMREGKNAAQAFGEAMVAGFGNALISMGSGYIALGLAKLLAGDASGGALAAQGGVLSALGAAMAASVGGGDTQGVGASAGGGGISGGGITASPEAAITSSPEAERQATTASVQVVVNGDVFDSEETSIRIAKLLEQGFSNQGLVFRGGVA